MKMEKEQNKKQWEKPELKKLGLEMENCCGFASPTKQSLQEPTQLDEPTLNTK